MVLSFVTTLIYLYNICFGFLKKNIIMNLTCLNEEFLLMFKHYNKTIISKKKKTSNQIILIFITRLDRIANM